MAEETPVVQNWRLLLVACILGLVVMVIYNFHIARVRSAGKGEDIVAYQYTRDMERGEKITLKGMEARRIPKDLAAGLGRLIRGTKNRNYAADNRVNRYVGKGDWVLWGHITGSDEDTPSGGLKKGMVAVPMTIDPLFNLGTILRIHDHVNIIGTLSVKSGRYRAYRMIKALKVLAIGGQGQSGTPTHRDRGSAERGMRSYRAITVEMKPEVSLQWANLQTYLRGSIRIELCAKRDELPEDAGMIIPELSGLTVTAAGGGAVYP